MDWIHCNVCFGQPLKEKQFSLTSCGHMYCIDCLGNGTENGICKLCNSSCSIIQLVPDMKSEAKEYFAEPEEMLGKLMHVLDFQKQHRLKLTAHWISLNQKFQMATNEVKRLRQIAEKMFGNLKDLHNENKALKCAMANRNTERNTPICNNVLPSAGHCSSVRSHMSQNTPLNVSKDYKSSLVTPLRVSKQRYPSNPYGNKKYSVNGYGSDPRYHNASTFLTPPFDTPGSK